MTRTRATGPPRRSSPLTWREAAPRTTMTKPSSKSPSSRSPPGSPTSPPPTAPYQPGPHDPPPPVDLARTDHRRPGRRARPGPGRARTGPPGKRTCRCRPQRRRGLAAAAPPLPRHHPRSADRHPPPGPPPQPGSKNSLSALTAHLGLAAAGGAPRRGQPAPPGTVGHRSNSTAAASAHRQVLAIWRHPGRTP